MIDFYAVLGKKLREARGEAELTQKELSVRVRLPRTSITNIEQGRQRIAVDQLVLFAAALGTEPAKLIPEEVPELEQAPEGWARPEEAEDPEVRQFVAGILQSSRGRRR